MSVLRHSKGTWRVEKTENGLSNQIVSVKEKTECNKKPTLVIADKIKRTLDANLMAASPRMLKVIQNAEKKLGKILEIEGSLNDMQDQFEAVQNELGRFLFEEFGI